MTKAKTKTWRSPVPPEIPKKKTNPIVPLKIKCENCNRAYARLFKLGKALCHRCFRKLEGGKK